MRALSIALSVLAVLIGVSLFRVADAQELWTVRSGVTTFYFNHDLLPDLRLDLTDISGDRPLPPEMEFRVEEPNWTFAIAPGSDLTFEVEHSIAVPYGVTGGSVVHSGSMTVEDLKGGTSQVLDGLEIAYLPATVEGPGGKHPSDMLILRDRTTREPVFELVNPMFDFHAPARVFWIHYRIAFSVSRSKMCILSILKIICTF